MAIADRIAINASGVIYYDSTAGANDHTTAGAEYYTVLELHRFLQDLADDAVASGDDLVDITSETPTDRSTDNIITILAPYTLDDGTVGGGDPVWEHIYDGSLIVDAQNGRTFDGLAVIAQEGMDLQIIQNGALIANDFWNAIPNGETLKGLNRDVGNGLSHRFMIEVIDNTGTPIDGRRIIGITREIGKTYSEFRVNGTARGNNVLALTFVDDLNDTTDASGRGTISNTEGYQLLQIDGTNNDPFYSQWDLDIYNSKQFYERMKWLTEAASGTTDTTPNATIYGLAGNIFRGITHEIALDTATQSVTDFSAVEPVSWTNIGTGEAGTGQMLAIDDVNAASKMWIQLLTGSAPNGDAITITGGTSTATIETNGATPSTERAISTPFCGQSTGSALIGAYGFGVDPADTTSSDLFRDLNDVTQQPPNNVTFTVQGLFVDEDRVLVGPENGSGGLLTTQAQVATAEAITVTAGAVSSATSGAGVVVLSSQTETIGTGQPSADDTPNAGTIRVTDANGIDQYIDYTSYTAGAGTLTFSGCTSVGTWSAAAANDAYIAYIDELASSTAIVATALSADTEYVIVTTGTTDFTLIGAADSNPGTIFTATGAGTGTGTAKPRVTTASVSVVYNTDRSVFIRVRDGGTAGDSAGIKTFETTGTIGSGGGSTTAIRTSDV